MTDPTDEDPTETGEGTVLETLSRRTLFGLVVALWSAGSLSDTRAARLLYGTQGYGRFGYGGETLEGTESEE